MSSNEDITQGNEAQSQPADSTQGQRGSQFLNPNSMLTPGVAGATSMAITNVLTNHFNFGAVLPVHIALIFSFLFGLLVIASGSMAIWKRAIYYVLNSLIIFTVAVGSNSLGAPEREESSGNPQTSAVELFVAPVASLGVATAYAQSSTTEAQKGWCCLNNRVNTASEKECSKWGGKFFLTKEEARKSCETKPPTGSQKTRTFFKDWFRKPK